MSGTIYWFRRADSGCRSPPKSRLPPSALYPRLVGRGTLLPLAGGLTPRAVLDKLAAVQMLDVNFPTTDGRTLVMRRYTELGPEQKLLVKQLKLDLPPQPPPRITAPATTVPVPPHPL